MYELYHVVEGGTIGCKDIASILEGFLYAFLMQV